MNTVLCLNTGSSSLKAVAFTNELHELRRTSTNWSDDHRAGFTSVINALDMHTPDVIAHRLVHGGPSHGKPCIIDANVVRQLHDLTPLAPLHLPVAIEVIELSMERFPNATHVACFDTAFHHDMPEAARRYALPVNDLTKDVRRYGFHGLSCEHVVSTLVDEQTRHLIIAHLGAGCSVTAVRDGRSVNTSMGFTPTGGVVMATRSGDLDPGLLTYLLHNGINADALDHMLNFESGLTALAGTGDMQLLLEREDNEARLAVDIFCSRIAEQIAAYTVTLNGLETVAFTGGIGEHATKIRDLIVEKLSILQPFEVVVVTANEESVMARQAIELLTGTLRL